MSGFRLSRAARTDLVHIAAHSAESWGAQHAANHLAAIYASLADLAAMPGLGRACDHIRPGLRRFEHEPHVLLYRLLDTGEIRIVRVLSVRMLPQGHVAEDDDQE